MVKKKNEVDATELLQALHTADESLEGFPLVLESASCMVTGDIDEAKRSQRLAMRLARDLTQSAVRLASHINRMEAEQRLRALEKKA